MRKLKHCLSMQKIKWYFPFIQLICSSFKIGNKPKSSSRLHQVTSKSTTSNLCLVLTRRSFPSLSFLAVKVSIWSIWSHLRCSVLCRHLVQTSDLSKLSSLRRRTMDSRCISRRKNFHMKIWNSSSGTCFRSEKILLKNLRILVDCL